MDGGRYESALVGVECVGYSSGCYWSHPQMVATMNEPDSQARIISASAFPVLRCTAQHSSGRKDGALYCCTRYSGHAGDHVDQLYGDFGFTWHAEPQPDPVPSLGARYDIIPPHALAAVAHAFTVGANKHDGRAYKPQPAHHFTAALMRHLEAWRMGETHAPDDGQHHLAAVIVRAMQLLELEREHPELMERPTGE